ncbi:COG0595 mRNA degradation ribonucleases J1/J2 (metallo-beta-lactamase superfamily) [Rhabdaerophilaceae bacterium]
MKEETLVFAALGGLGEIGMNMALYGFGPSKKRQWIMVDCGVSFAGPDLPGVDLIMPDISFIEAEKRSLLGIIITHAHEDHFGAVADLWPRLGAPVYMTPFAANLMEARRFADENRPHPPVRVVPQRGEFKLGPFHIETIPVAHSIPESMALAIRTPLGTVLHTGDWKIDETPVLGEPTDEARLRALGDEGVLAMVCDSTNIVREGISPSESDVRIGLRDLILSAKGRVAITTFASNVGRMRAIAEAAAEAGREVVLVGRAMDRVAEVAGELDMLNGLPEFSPAPRFKSVKRDKCVLILTGSQGEPRAALARIASGDHPDVELSPGDRVIFSSRAIPGNEKAIGGIINNLARMGIEVITDRDGLVHVSGHPRREELRRMYEWVRPKTAIPAHGEALHLTLHRDFAKAQGVRDVIRAFNGDLVQLAPGRAAIIDEVRVGQIVKDGNFLISALDDAIRERRKLSFAGTILIALAMDERGNRIGTADIALVGVPSHDDEGEPMEAHVRDLVEENWKSMPKAARRDPEAVRRALERGVRAGISDIWDKKPYTKVLIVEM